MAGRHAGSKIAVAYLSSRENADETVAKIEAIGGQAYSVSNGGPLVDDVADSLYFVRNDLPTAADVRREATSSVILIVYVATDGDDGAGKLAGPNWKDAARLTSLASDAIRLIAEGGLDSPVTVRVVTKRLLGARRAAPATTRLCDLSWREADVAH